MKLIFRGEKIDNKYVNKTNNTIIDCNKCYENGKRALAGVAQWIECRPVNQKVASSIPSIEHMPGFRARSPVWGAQEATTH